MTDWPRCPNCGDSALEGQATCGRESCEEALERVDRPIHVTGRRKRFWVLPDAPVRRV